MEIAAALARFGQFLAATVLCGAPMLFLYGMERDAVAAWRRPLLVAAAGLGAVSTLAWLMVQASSLAESPAAAIDPAAVWSVAAGTGFGRAASVRALLFAVALLALAVRPSRPWPAVAALGLGAAASFAWTGHGGADDGAAGLAHRLADIAHLAAAAIWVGALAALAMMAKAGPASGLDRALRRFSGVGPAMVAVLVLSGVVNSWFLVGPGHVAGLLDSPYGALLSFKLALFAAMLALAGLNRWRLSPRLSAAAGPAEQGRALAAVRASVLIETVLALAVLAVVALLGTLEPPIAR